MQRTTVTHFQLATMVDQLGDHKMQLNIGLGQCRIGFEEATAFGEISGQ